MGTIIELLGSMALSAIIISLPILCTLSYVYSWANYIQLLLTVVTIVEYLLLTCFLYFEN